MSPDTTISITFSRGRGFGNGLTNVIIDDVILEINANDLSMLSTITAFGRTLEK